MGGSGGQETSATHRINRISAGRDTTVSAPSFQHQVERITRQKSETVISQLDIQESASNAEARRKRDSLRCMVAPNEKSKDFFARLLARRQTPGNCVRCGHKNPQPKYKTCPRCLAAVARRKKEALEKPTVETRAVVKRIESLEMAVANLQHAHSKIYQRAYRAGQQSIRIAAKRAAREVERLDAHRYADALPTIHPQELATMNHAYDRQ